MAIALVVALCQGAPLTADGRLQPVHALTDVPLPSPSPLAAVLQGSAGMYYHTHVLATTGGNYATLESCEHACFDDMQCNCFTYFPDGSWCRTHASCSSNLMMPADDKSAQSYKILARPPPSMPPPAPPLPPSPPPPTNPPPSPPALPVLPSSLSLFPNDRAPGDVSYFGARRPCHDRSYADVALVCALRTLTTSLLVSSCTRAQRRSVPRSHRRRSSGLRILV